jgi:hypothetical protein
VSFADPFLRSKQREVDRQKHVGYSNAIIGHLLLDAPARITGDWN